MPITQFPNPESADDDGIVAVGGDLNTSSLILAYQNGIFPWPMGGLDTVWFSPPQRTLMMTKDFKLSRSFFKNTKKSFLKAKNGTFEITLNHAFDEVITQCALALRPDQNGTWITDTLLKAYVDLHKIKNAYSIEVWCRNQLVGGLYGVNIAGFVSAESMFYKVSGASKLALATLNQVLIKNQISWFDIQMQTPHMEKLGAQSIGRSQFLKLLKASLNLPESTLCQKQVLNLES